MNLLPDGAEGYTGTLFFSPLSEDNTYGIVYQQVAVRPDGDFWTVEPLGELEALRLPDEGAIPAPDDHIPHITYAAETVDLRLEVDLTYFLTCSDIWVGYMSLSDGGWAGGRTFRIGGGDRPSPVPAPHAAFTSCCKRSELSANPEVFRTTFCPPSPCSAFPFPPMALPLLTALCSPLMTFPESAVCGTPRLTTPAWRGSPRSPWILSMETRDTPAPPIPRR